jgi:hypothetical protein
MRIIRIECSLARSSASMYHNWKSKRKYARVGLDFHVPSTIMKKNRDRVTDPVLLYVAIFGTIKEFSSYVACCCCCQGTK